MFGPLREKEWHDGLNRKVEGRKLLERGGARNLLPGDSAQ